ncbi:efflux transporter outer membrane subunit [Sphingomonas solaris]|uniref:Efflux transporter outer membrane subunit n=1 Tax=Alterirhizorhabdus solaris TaxID=2529389 RepID=A0A558R8A4_9SPHN|nr:efflux transporter outer membrane subunit [Sphingomonas solaris]TVV75629.1 efflux transporter outer membrane subunit [Sphingomonas solaris]
MIRRLATLAAFGALAACSLEPTYVRPAPPVPAGWPVGDAYLRQSEAALPTVTYRDIFRDPRLQRVIERALANNQDIAVALANVASARALYRVERSALLPAVDAAGRVSISDSGTGSTTTGTTGTGTGTIVSSGGGTRTVYTANVGVTAFELDLFGRIRNLNKAALQEYLATEAAVRAARLTIVGDVASAWLTLATDRSLLAIAIDTEASAKRSVDLTDARRAGGIAPRSDVRQAQTVLEQARSDRANLVTLVAQDRNALELLVGTPVADADLPASIESVDGTLATLPAGLDSRILLRRPDVVQAEYVLRAANARIGAARAAFFPTISLTAAVGFASTALSSLFTGGAFTWSAAPAVGLPIFDGGANRGNLAYAEAQADRAVALYRQTIQIAFREVADALARQGTVATQAAANIALEEAARDNYVLADARYREGIDTFLTSLDAQRTLYNARRSLASTRLVRATNLVELYRTLGGDELIDPAVTAAPAPTR